MSLDKLILYQLEDRGTRGETLKDLLRLAKENGYTTGQVEDTVASLEKYKQIHFQHGVYTFSKNRFE